MSRMTANDIRRRFTGVVNRVASEGERIIISLRNKDIAAIVSLEDLKLIERIEDEIDVEEAKKILENDEETITWDEAMNELGMK